MLRAPIDLLAWLVAPALAVPGLAQQRISVGEEIRGSLERGASVECEIVRERAGPLSVELSSLDFDAVLEASNAQGPIAIAGDQGWDTDELASFDLLEGQALRLRVRSAAGDPGEFVLRAFEKATGPDERLGLRLAGLEERARAHAERGDPRAAAGFLHRAGRLCLRAGDLRAARAHAEHELEAAGKSGDRSSIARACLLLGAIQNSLGDRLGALDSFAKAKAGEDDLAPADRLALLQGMGIARFDSGEREAGLELLARAVERARELGSPMDVAIVLALEASRLIDASRLVPADGRLREAELLAAHGTDRRVRAEVGSVRARWFQGMNRWKDALRAGQEALALDPPPTTRLVILGTLAAAHENLDELSQAYRLGQDSQSLCQALGIAGFEDEYEMLFGNILLKGGDPAGARGHLEKALAIRVESGDLEGQLETLLSLASACYGLGDLEGQREACAKSLAIADRLGDRRGECRASCLQGRALQPTDPAQSEASLSRSIELARAIGDLDLEADARGILAWGRHVWGREREALAGARDAVRLYGLLDKRLQSVEALDTQVAAALGSGDLESASDGIDDALARFDRAAVEVPDDPTFSSFDRVIAGFGRHAQDWVAKSLARSDAAAPPDDDGRRARDVDRRRILERGLRLAGMFKSRGLLRMMVADRRGELGNREREIRGELERSRTEWRDQLAARTAALRREPEPGELQAFLEQLEASRRRTDDLRADLARVVAESLRDSTPPPAVLPEVRRALPVGGLLVEYAFGNDDLYAYAVDAEDVRFVDVGPSATWEKAVQEFVSGLCGEAAQINRVTSTRPYALLGREELRESGRRLYRGILAPALGTEGAAGRDLVIVPAGFLCTLPFEALTVPGDPAVAPADPPQAPKYLLEESPVAYAPSIPVLLEIARLAEQRQRVWPPTALLIADPDYEGGWNAAVPDAPGAARDSGGASGRFRGLMRLDNTRDEACSIAGRLLNARLDSDPSHAAAILRIQMGKQQSSSDSWTCPGIELHVGANATRSCFLEKSGRFSLLHVAAHGFADLQQPEEGCFVLSWDEKCEGRVTASDILSNRLTADLTVLAACQTAIGPDAPHEGVLSLARAFLHAGSGAVIASLWSADDLQTRELMEHFYAKYLDEKMAPAAALREAKLHLLRTPTVRGRPAGISPDPEGARKTTTADPYFWAPYLYFGSPR